MASKLVTDCPFCGKTFNGEYLANSPSTIGEPIRYIMDKYGSNVLLDQSRFMNVFRDVEPDISKNKKIFLPLYSALNLELPRHFLQASADDKNESFNVIYIKFEPLLKKHARKLGDDDTKYMLAEALYSALLKIPIHLEHFKQDKYIISYISKSIYTEYLKISKFNSKTSTEYSLDDSHLESSLNETTFDEFWYKNLVKYISSILSNVEWKYFSLRFILNYSETEIAEMLVMS